MAAIHEAGRELAEGRTGAGAPPLEQPTTSSTQQTRKKEQRSLKEGKKTELDERYCLLGFIDASPPLDSWHSLADSVRFSVPFTLPASRLSCAGQVTWFGKSARVSTPSFWCQVGIGAKIASISTPGVV